MEPNSNSMMKTKLTLFVAALSSALFGVGCVAPVETASGILLPTKTAINNKQPEETGKRKLVPCRNQAGVSVGGRKAGGY